MCAEEMQVWPALKLLYAKRLVVCTKTPAQQTAARRRKGRQTSKVQLGRLERRDFLIERILCPEGELLFCTKAVCVQLKINPACSRA